MEKLFEKYNLTSRNTISIEQLTKIINDMDMKVEEGAISNQIDELLLGQPKSGTVEIYQKVISLILKYNLIENTYQF